MVIKLRIVRQYKEVRQPSVRSACEILMTDPMDEDTGVPSTWGTMLEEMVLKGKFNFKGEFSTEWRYK